MSVCTQLHVYGKVNAISTLTSHVMPTYSRDLLPISFWSPQALWHRVYESYKGNRNFDWSIFRKDTVKIYFDGLYGLDEERLKLQT